MKAFGVPLVGPLAHSTAGPQTVVNGPASRAETAARNTALGRRPTATLLDHLAHGAPAPARTHLRHSLPQQPSPPPSWQGCTVDDGPPPLTAALVIPRAGRALIPLGPFFGHNRLWGIRKHEFNVFTNKSGPRPWFYETRKSRGSERRLYSVLEIREYLRSALP